MNHDNAHCLDYIKREDAINVFDWGMPDADVKCGIAIQNIKDIPSPDVVEVVRCKDCKHYVIHTLFGHSQGWCERLCDEFDKSLAHGAEEYDYCSFGERTDT